MTAAELLLLAATMHCHTITVDITAERQTLAYTVCVKVEVLPSKEEAKPIVAEAPKAPVVKKPVKKRVTKCKRKYYWKNHRKYWRCVR